MRRELDLRTAEALGLPEDCIPAFLTRMEAFDRRTPEWEERMERETQDPRLTVRLGLRL